MEQSLRSEHTRMQAAVQAFRGLLHRGAHTFTVDAQAWSLTSGRALMIALAPLFATLLFVAAMPFHRLFYWLIDEDSLLETVQFVLILAAGVVFGRLSVRLYRSDSRWLGLLYGAVALGSFFVAGEEISWGQRIFGWETPPQFEAVNAQQEISVHNIHGFHQPFIYAVMLAGMYGTLAPLFGLAFSATRNRSPISYLLVPPLCLIPAFFLPFGYRLCRLALRPELYVAPGYRVFVITEFNELTELSLYFGLLVFAWLNLRRLRPKAQ